MPTTSRLLSIANEYLDDCFSTESVPHAAELARQLGAQPWTLTRRFQSEAGISPSVYLKRVQVRRAITLLQTTTLTTAEIAYRAGFVSRRTLFRAIRRVTGRSPNAFRVTRALSSGGQFLPPEGRFQPTPGQKQGGRGTVFSRGVG